MSRIYDFDKRIQSWIENNRIKWCFGLFFLGVLLAIGFNILMNAQTQNYFNMSLLFGSMFVFTELIAGGSGVPSIDD